MNMSEPPISVSDIPKPPIDRLWQISRTPLDAANADELSALGWLASHTELDAGYCVAEAVRLHLAVLCAISSGRTGSVGTEAYRAVEMWAFASRRLGQEKAKLTTRSHAFHARLSSRHREAFEAFERERLLQWAEGARLKSQMIVAAIAFRSGKTAWAAEAAREIANRWRAAVPVRLPGLGDIERAAARWSAQTGSAEQSRLLADRAASLTGTLAPYPEDMPQHWPSDPNRESLLRFGFAATVLPEAILLAR